MRVLDFNYTDEVEDKRAIKDERTNHHYVSVGTKQKDAWEYRLPIDDRHIKSYGKILTRMKLNLLMNKYESATQLSDKMGNNVFVLTSGKRDNSYILCINEIIDDVVSVEHSLYGDITTLGTGITRSKRNNKIKVPMLHITGDAILKIVRVYDDSIKTVTLTFTKTGCEVSYK